MTKTPLLDLFYQLRETVLPLTIDQYYLAVDALEKSTLTELDFISDELAIKQLCRIIWVKSKQQKKLFDECWEDWKQNPSSQILESKSPVSQSTLPDAERKQEQTPPEQDNQDNQDNNLNNTAGEPEGDSPEGEEEKSITRISPRNVDVVTAIKLKLSDEKIKEKDYLPASIRKLQKSLDKLMSKSSEDIPSQLAIEDTVTDVAKRGFFVKSIFTAAQTKEKEVVLLIDRQGSMAPFHPLCRQLVEICKARTVYYFHNSPTDELYYDPKCWDGKSIKFILKKFSKKNTLVVIISDAGAARQRSVYERYEETYDFLELLIPKVKRVAWLNPLPRFRWQDNTAEEIAKINALAPMFALETEEFEQMVQWLRDGKTTINKFLEKANKSAKEEWKKHQFDGSNSWDLGFDAEGRIEFFKQRFGEPHLHFASCGAFPLVLTPDLLYCLWDGFFIKSSSQTKKSQISSLSEKPEFPWYAVADLLLSDLCQQVYSLSDEEELYEMEREIRNELLKRCKKEFGEKIIEKLSEFLIEYINLQLSKQSNKKSLSSQFSELYEVQQWTALAYTKPDEAAKELASKLKQAYLQSNKAELVRLSEVTETFVEPLKDYKPLLVVARGYAAIARGDKAGAEVSKNELEQEYSSHLVKTNINVAEVLLELPDINKIRFLMQIQKFSFNVVTVNRRGEIINRETKEAKYFTETISPPPSEEEERGEDITLDMVYIPGGTFMMGTEDEEVERLVEEYSSNFFREEKPQHEVTVPAFFMGKHKVTREQWKAVAALPPVYQDLQAEPSYSSRRGRDDLGLPVELVWWYDAVEFCARLSNYTGRKYRLPSEAEWEYACRAGTTTPFYFGETITGDLANYRADEIFAEEPKQEFPEESNPVGKFYPNAFGLYDMHGNVNEWCLDDYHDNYVGAPTDGSPWFDDNDNDNIYQKKGKVVVRGGQFMNKPESCRSAARDYSISVKRDIGKENVGFRVVCEVGEDS